MTKAQWQAHRSEVGPHDAASCEQCKARMKTKRANARKRDRDDAYRSAGLVKVFGSVSGRTYWE
jgi:hypothetical protein